MTTYTANQNVDPGLYFNLTRFHLESVDRQGPLPGTDTDVYRRVPMVVMLALAPLLGLAFVIFLPFLGFAMVGRLLAAKTAEAATGAATAAVRVMRPGWAPALAFFSRTKPNTTREPHVPPADAWAEDVERKLDPTKTDER
ncbi:MAG: hypothetical protein IPL75_00970 [Acidobacteria bacterium]|jgi:hypothetical protein|nr:hypothetical protein [Acidobacteriota bacterium]